jgi:hypothetical protein
MAGYKNGKLPPWPRHHGKTEGKPICDRRADMAVGKVVFQRDENERVYRKPDALGGGGSIERYHYVPRLVESETKISWVLHTGHKVSKKDPRFVYGIADVEDEIWKRRHRWRIESALVGATADQLRQIAAIIGYDESRAEE